MAEIITKNDAFFAELLSPSAAKWSAGVAFDRSNGLPLDQWSVFQSEAKAIEYLSNAKAYPGQVIAYAEANGEMKVCVLSQNAEGTALTLKPVGIIPSGDAKTIEVSDTGVISLKGAAAATAGQQPRIKNVGTAEEPKLELEWYTPDNSTVAGLQDTVGALKESIDGIVAEDGSVTKEGLTHRVNALEIEVGAPAAEDVEATGLYKVIEEATAEAIAADTNTTYTLAYEPAVTEGENLHGPRFVFSSLEKGAEQAVDHYIDATPFIKDGLLKDVSYNPDDNTLTFTWNTDAGDKVDTVVLTDIIEPYSFTEGALINITEDGTNITIAHEAVAAPTATAGTGRTYITEVTTDGYGHITGYKTATESDQDLSNFKTKQTAYSADGSTTKTITGVTQNENGEVTVVYGDIAFPVDKDTTYTLADATANNDKVKLTLTPSEGAVQTVDVNTYSAAKIDALLPKKVSELENDKYFLTAVNMRAADEDKGYAPILQVNHNGTVVTVDDEALQNTIKGVKQTADTAVQTAKFAGTAFTKNGTELSISQADARTALGLGSAAYADTDAFAPAGNYKTKQTTQGDTLTGAQVVSTWSQNANGEVAITTRDLTPADIGAQPAGNYQPAGDYQPAGNYKVVQEAVSDPVAEAATGTTLTYIDTISQNTNGVISATKKTFDLANAIGNLTNVMNFRGVITKTEDSTLELDLILAGLTDPAHGDIILYGQREYIYVVDNEVGSWMEFGDAAGVLTAAQTYTDTAIGNIFTNNKASNTAFGVVKGSENGVSIANGEVVSVSTDILAQGAQELIFCAGNASGYGTI